MDLPACRRDPLQVACFLSAQKTLYFDIIHRTFRWMAGLNGFGCWDGTLTKHGLAYAGWRVS